MGREEKGMKSSCIIHKQFAGREKKKAKGGGRNEYIEHAVIVCPRVWERRKLLSRTPSNPVCPVGGPLVRPPPVLLDQCLGMSEQITPQRKRLRHHLC
jgi:hypothetical protein